MSSDSSLIKTASLPLKDDENIEFYFVTDENGNVLDNDKIQLFYNLINSERNLLNIDTTFVSNDEKYIVNIKPIINDNVIVGYVGLGISLNSVHEYITKLNQSILFFVIVVLSIGLVLIVLFTKIILQPLNLLNNKISEVSNGNYSVRLQATYKDEIGLLAINFNQMAENLEITSAKLKHEISQRENTEEELLFTQKTLYDSLEKQKELNLLKSRFISMISHEYRTPLTTISNSTYLLEQYSKKGDLNGVEKFSNMIKSSVNRMTVLLEDVLKVSQEEKLKMDLKLVKVNLSEFCNDICEEFKLVDHFKHNFVYDFDNINITIETKIFQLIVKNLISNAIKYSPANSDVYFSVKLLDNQLVIIVKDSGIGITPKDLENLFVPFHRGENVGAIEGTGLGMAIIKDCVEILLGEIDVDSKIGENSYTQFTVKFPIVNNSMIVNPNN